MPLLPLLALAATQVATVSVDLPAAPAWRMLPLLGKQLGIPLEASTACRNQVLYAHGKATPEAFMKALATAAYAMWDKGSDGVTRLAPDAGRRLRKLKEEAAERAEGWARAFEHSRKKAAELKTSDWKKLAKDADAFLTNFKRDDNDVWGTVQPLEAQSPKERLMTRIQAALPPELFADPPEYGFALSDQPNRAQYPLGPGVMDAVKIYLKEQAAWHDAAGKLDFSDRRQKKEMWYGGSLMDTSDAPVAFGRIVVRAGRGDQDFESESLSLRMRVYSPSGDRLMDDQRGIGPRAKDQDDMLWTKERQAKAEADYKVTLEGYKKTALVPMTPLAKAQRSLFQWSEKKTEVDPALEAQALDVVENEPLAGLMGTFLDVVSKERKLPFVAWLRDGDSFTGGGDEVRVGMALDMWKRFVDEADGFLTFKVLDLKQALKSEMDRAVLARVIRTSLQAETTLEEKAEIAYLTLSQPWGSLVKRIPARLKQRRSGSNYEFDYGDWQAKDFLPIYGALSAAQRRQAASPQGLPTRSLQGDARTMTLAMVYGPNKDLKRFAVPKGNETVPQEDHSEGQKIGNEPTILWPGGPPAGVLRIVDTTDVIVATAQVREEISKGSARIWGGYPQTPSEFGSSQKWRDNPMPGQATSEIGDCTDYTKLKHGTRRSLKISVVFDPTVRIEGTLTDNRWKSAIVPIAQLPKEIRDSIEKAKQ